MKDFAAGDRADILSSIAELSGRIGFDVVEVAGFLDGLGDDAKEQIARLKTARSAAGAMSEANDQVARRTDEVAKASEAGLEIVLASVDGLRRSGDRARRVAEWVRGLEGRIGAIEAMLETVVAHNRDVSSIARQVKMLAINAKIEATRAGEAGAGFSKVADAVRELSSSTTRAGDSITDATGDLTRAMGKLRAEACEITSAASDVLSDAAATDTALSDIAREVERTAAAAEGIAGRVGEMRRAVETFRPAFDGIADQVARTADEIGSVRRRVHTLIDTAETMVRATVDAGASAADARFIDKAREIAAEIGRAFEEGVASGRISEAALFSQEYQPIPGSDPPQVMAPFTAFTDRVLPPIQEAALDFDPAIVFCAAVDRRGYLPTHNRKFSRPQGADPVQNAAFSRNRRIFDDRVGLKAGRNSESFLLQVYRRDMGGGEFALMKDLSAPIFVGGRHWGGVRLAFRA